jgi:hypothetical protein
MSNDQHTVLRSMHDLGLATWFGGNLMGAVGLNKAAAAAHDSTERTRLSSIGWAAWWPVQGAAMAAHLVGSVGMLRADRGRLATEPGATVNTVVKTALTVAATEPSAATPPDVAAAQKGQKPLQWVNPALTGALIVLAAQQGEQQRTSSPVKGALGAGLASLKAAVLRA